jgi:hypothetical protein
MASEKAMIATLKRKVNLIPGARIKKLWSSAVNRDIDILVVIHGLAGFYEIKVPGQKPTDWQVNQLLWWSHSGADTGWFDDVDKCVARVQQIANRAALHKRTLAEILAK